MVLKFGHLIYMIYLSTATGLTPGGSSTVHIYTQTMHRTTQVTTEQHKQQLIWKSAGCARLCKSESRSEIPGKF
jgi:uncharacterized integral membrane protein